RWPAADRGGRDAKVVIRLLGHTPDAGIARRPVVPALHTFPPRGDVGREDGRDPRHVRPQLLLELRVDLRPLLLLERLAAGLAEAIQVRALVAGLAAARLPELAVVRVGVGPRGQPGQEEIEVAVV